MCVLATYGPANGLSPCTSPGYANARLVSFISCENVSFVTIQTSMHAELVPAFRRLIFVEI